MIDTGPSIADMSLCGYLYYPVEESGYSIAERVSPHQCVARARTRNPWLGIALRHTAGRENRPKMVTPNITACSRLCT
jgi:hypothetical protein